MGVPDSRAPAGERLDSWKEISAYLKRDPRTLQRWEKKEGLPVHRHAHDSQVSIYAYTSELDAWLASRTLSDGHGSASNARPTRPARRRALLWTGLLTAAIGAGTYLVIRYASPAKAGIVHQRQLLQREDVDMPGGPSWDGRFVPYRTTDAEMHILEVETGKSRLVLKPPPAGNYVNFVASPDGKQVAYDLEFRDGPAQLRVVSTDSSEDRLVFTDPRYQAANPKSWSPDGSQIATMLWAADGARSLALVNAKSKAVRVLYTSRNGPGNPQFSPDGRYLAFNEKGNILAIPSLGGVPTEAVSHPAMDMIAGWAPDGCLVFTSDRSGKTDLYTVKLREGRPEGPPNMIRRDLNAGMLSTTRNGSLIYSSNLPVREVYTAELDPAGNLAAGPSPLGGAPFVGQNREPDYSRDGQFLAYVSGPEGSPNTSIRVRLLATREERAIPLPLSAVDQLRWYPDGKAILLRGRNGPDEYGFYQLDIGPVHLTPVLTTGIPDHPAVNGTFSPNGKYLYYLALPTPTVQVLMRLDLGTGDTREVHRPQGRFLRMYALSPDGSEVALQERETHPDKTFRDFLYVKHVSSGEPRLLGDEMQGSRAFGALAWAADGKAVLYHRPDVSAFQRDDLVRIPRDGGPPQALVTTDTIWRIAAHPDGRRIIWQANGRVWNVSILEDLFVAGR